MSDIDTAAMWIGYIVMFAGAIFSVSILIWCAGETLWRRCQQAYGLAFMVNAARHVQREIDAGGVPLCGGGREHDRWGRRWPRPWPCPKCAALRERRQESP